jgi:hypothetical protein
MVLRRWPGSGRTGEWRARRRAEIVVAAPNLADYQTKTTRAIPVVILTAVP